MGASKGTAMQRIPPGIFLLRKSKGGEHVPVLKDNDFPATFHFSGRTFEINRTRKGRLIMTEAK